MGTPPTSRWRVIVGVDPGVTYAGVYALEFSSDVPELARPLQCASFEEPLSGKKQRHARYWHWTSVARRICDWVRMQIYHLKPDMIAVEDFVWIGRRRRGMLTMAKIVSGLCFSLQWPWMTYTPGDWRVSLGNFKRNADYVDLMEHLRQYMPPQNAHEEDAFGICVCCMLQTLKGEVSVL